MQNLVKIFGVFMLSLGLLSCGTSELTDEDGRTIKELQITPTTLDIAQGYAYQFEAIATLSDHSTLNLTNLVDWGSTDQTIADMSDQGRGIFHTVGQVKITARIGEVVGNVAMVEVNQERLDSLEISTEADSSSIAKGYNRQYHAEGLFTDQSTLDLTDQVDWHSSNENIATVTPKGLVSFISEGSVIITADINQKMSNPLTVTVTAAELTNLKISETAEQLAKGLFHQYEAIGIFSDGTENDISNQVTWHSSDPNLAEIDEWGGASFKNEGVVTIHASRDGVVSNDSVVTITPAVLTSMIITVSSANTVNGIPTIAINESVQLRVYGIFSDTSTTEITHDISWHSSDTFVATVDLAGLVTAGAPGLVTIDGYHPAVGSSSIILNVTMEIEKI